MVVTSQMSFQVQTNLHSTSMATFPHGLSCQKTSDHLGLMLFFASQNNANTEVKVETFRKRDFCWNQIKKIEDDLGFLLFLLFLEWPESRENHSLSTFLCLRTPSRMADRRINKLGALRAHLHVENYKILALRTHLHIESYKLVRRRLKIYVNLRFAIF